MNFSAGQPFFENADFDALASGNSCEKGNRQHQRVMKIREDKILPLSEKLFDKLNYVDKRVGSCRPKVNQCEYLYFAFYESQRGANETCLNFFLGKHGLHILANAELKQSFGRYYNNIMKYPEYFDSIIRGINLDTNYSSRIYSQIPLRPENIDLYYMKLQRKFSQSESNSENILTSLDEMKNNLNGILSDMLNDIDNSPRYSRKDSEYFRNNYLNPETGKKKSFEASVSLRFNYLIPRDFMVNLTFQELVVRILEVEREIKPLIIFGNQR